jgi:hypothetical protein
MEAGKMVHEAPASAVLGSKMLHKALLGGH